ncbi:hypothetical protein SAMN05444671_1218 [Flavobacterium sp. CF108]|uniref:hypothetical protein n=1 Tax=unclassified Flavobacterium TaxID=196869 RepID=UPI0008D7BE02|nr:MULTISPECIES: hypothetical protein [unclassified Flavobacterium]SEO85613.1 hypothetical protein SAMN04487978_3835 [Flavobacterium sp. fv08]SHG69690.1 hypothetical protein SAMN05444671_1218 [Flavobacterium sp. CF108]
MEKYFLMIFICFTKTYGQYKISNIKKFAFNQCVILNYSKIDSTFYNNLNDVSTVQFSINGLFFEDELLKNKIIDYTINTTSSYYSQKNNLHFETGDKNIIFCKCFDFYESKELDSYIKKIVGINNKKKIINKKK